MSDEVVGMGGQKEGERERPRPSSSIQLPTHRPHSAAVVTSITIVFSTFFSSLYSGCADQIRIP